MEAVSLMKGCVLLHVEKYLLPDISMRLPLQKPVLSLT
jgi:hypothetical protein